MMTDSEKSLARFRLQLRLLAAYDPAQIERDEAALGMTQAECVAALFPDLSNWPEFIGPNASSYEGQLASLRHLAAWLALARVEQADPAWTTA